MINTKIFVTYHDKHKIIKSDIITPIQTGRAIANEVLEGMIGDDTGDNISKQNPKYSECSAQYWVWKNYDKIGNPDYVGFMHYRRHFIFNDKKYDYSSLGVKEFDEVSQDYIDEIKLYDNDAIINKIKNYDIVVGNKIDCRKFAFLPAPTPREAFRYNEDLRVQDYDLMIQTVIELYPEYRDVVKKIEKGYIQYWYNMFIMSKQMFRDYSEFWWNIVSVLEKKIDTTMYGENAHRILGYLSERILGIFVIYQQTHKKKIKELGVSFVKNTDVYDEIKPVFKSNYIAVSLISSNYFVPYLATTLQSIKVHSDPNVNYDIVILTRDMEKKNQERIVSLYSDKNISIRFVKIPFTRKMHVGGHVSIETYMRLMVPRLFKKYDRVLYLDCDIVVKKDICYFRDIVFNNKSIAVVKDFTLQSFVNNSHRDDNQYVKQKLGIKDPYSVFNGGVILFNIKAIDENFEQVLYKLLDQNDYRYYDQDPLNMYFQNKILYIEAKWNLTVLSLSDISIKCLPQKSKQELLQALLDPGVIHYNSNIKPWFYPEECYADIWWSYARQTPFYEEILARALDFRKTQSLDYHVINIIAHPISFLLKKSWYRLLKHVSYGGIRKYYREKYQRMKEQIKLIN